MLGLLLGLLRGLLRLIGGLLCLCCNGLGVAYDLLLSLDRCGHCTAHGSLRSSGNGRQLRGAN